MRPALVDSLVFVHVVSIHVLARGATGTPSSTRARCSGFNPRARTGRDFLAARACSGARSFNPRARTGGDAERLRHHGRLHVSIHAPARGATLADVCLRAVRVVSIHAPARGATRGAARVISIARVSIHAPPRGATNDGLESTYSALFQSTRPHGARPHAQGLAHAAAAVSIHAPARGATVMRPRFAPKRLFQSTRPHGARRGPHRGGRRRDLVSIHAPARGATRPT